ncbi:MAG: flagellar hook-associated protein FlgL [Candidatus Tectomicrobia bacterium]|nr:flagellar hook-associated protein FlgL [Candidatus Tectomicrobia bacterium]
MRVSDATTWKNFVLYMQRAREQLQDLQAEAASGKRLNRPSDSPADNQRVLRLRQSLAQFDQYERNIRRGKALLGAAETSLSQAGEVIQKMKDIAVAGANGTVIPSTRAAMAQEAASLRDRLVQLANTQFEGQYIFSGTKTDTPAYSTAGTYGGNSGTMQVAIARDARVTVNKPGDQVFGAAGGGVDILAAANALETALQSGDLSGIQAQIDALEAGRSQVINVRAELGASETRLDGTQTSLDTLRLALREQLSLVEDADLVETITALQSQENVLKATLASHANVSNLSLLDFLQ